MDAGNFIESEVRADIATGRYSRGVCTRFSPEPGGFSHLGHAKASTISLDLADSFDGHFVLRMDDTNPEVARQEFVDAMVEDMRWLHGDRAVADVRFASSYFETLADYTNQLILQGDAYVDLLSPKDIRDYRGDFYTPGRPSPFRERAASSSLSDFEQMLAGKSAPGEMVVRAKIDMASPNMNMRDPIMYRVIQEPHYRQGEVFAYPLYDFAHPISDAIEGITHSICGLEFAGHGPIYDWYLQKLKLDEPPRQIEFGEIGLENSVLSKRKLRALVNAGVVDGWNDPRLPTLAGLRRLGAPASAVVDFCRTTGVSQSISGGLAERSLLDHHIRQALEPTAPRYMGVRKPLRLELRNIPADFDTDIRLPVVPERPEFGEVVVQLSSSLWIEQDDFMENPPPKYHRLTVGQSARLRGACLVRCTGFERNEATGEPEVLYADWSGPAEAKRDLEGHKVKGTLHWVSRDNAAEVPIREYGDLLSSEQDDDSERTILERFSTESLIEYSSAKVDQAITELREGTQIQLVRLGFFTTDVGSDGQQVLNTTVPLRDARFRQIFAPQPS